MAFADEIPRSWTLPSLALLLAIVAAPTSACLWVSPALWQPLVAGAGLWAGSVFLKRAFYALWSRATGVRRHSATAAAQGLLSALAELGLAALYFAWAQLSVLEAACVGIGAGCAEAAYVLALSLVGPRPSDETLRAWIEGARSSYCVRFMVPLERLFALVGHTGARGLVYVGLYAPAAVAVPCMMAALLLFSAIDGVAVYGHLENWNWFDPRICRRAHAYFSTLAVIEAAGFALAVTAGLSRL